MESRNIYKQPVQEEVSIRSSQYEDVFNYSRSASNSIKNDLLHHPLLKTAVQTTQNYREASFNYILNASSVSQQKLVHSIMTLQTDMQSFINNFLSYFVNITDKISAVYGEREKDIREKLSDTFKSVEIKLYELLAPVDTSMNQNDHNKEKRTRDPEKKSQKEDEHKFTHRVD